MKYSYNLVDIFFRYVLCYINNLTIKQLSTNYPKINYGFFRDFRIPPRNRWGLRFSGLLHFSLPDGYIRWRPQL